MSQLNRTRKIDPAILSSSDAILDDILGRLGITLHVATSGCDERFERAIDPDVAGLRGSLFDGLSTREIPLEAFRVDEPGEPAPVSRPRTDSFAPITMGGAPSTSPPPAMSPPSTERGRAGRRAPRVLGYAVAAGLAGFVAVGALTRIGQEARPAAAVALAAPDHLLPAGSEPAPEPVALVQDPAPTAKPALVPVTRPAPAAAPRSAPRPAAVAARAAAAAPVSELAAAGAPAAVDQADLMPLVPPLAPKPQVAFDRAAAAVAIAGGGARAASCRAAGAGSMDVPVRVTFAPSGSAVSAGVTGGPLVGTSEGGCVAAALRGARVPAFDGEPVAVNTVAHLR